MRQAAEHVAMEEMAPPFDVALLGFGNFERSALVSYLRLSGSHTAAYRQTESIAEADFLVADTDHAGTLDAVLGADRVGDTVFIGSLAPEGALAWMMRPIDPLQVFRELDAAVQLRRARAAEPLSRPMPMPSASADQAAESAVQEAPAPPEPPPSRRADDEAQPLSVLLVDGNDSTLRALEAQLRGLGLRTETASSSQRALDLLAQATFDLVLLEVDLGPQSELDGLSLCQVLKRSRTRDQPGPLLVVASQECSATDKARAAFAGCDAHLTKPLDDATLRRALRRLGLRLAGSADTGFNSRPGSLQSRHVPMDR